MAQNRISDPSGERGLFNTIDGLDTRLHTARGGASDRDIATKAGGIIAGDQWFNTDTQILQIYNGTAWNNVYTPSPVITSVSPITTTGSPNIAITINGLNFGTTPIVYFLNNANGNKVLGTGVTFVNTSQLIVQTPALLQSGSPYGVQVVNLDTTNGSTGSLITVNAGTAWVTTAGQLFNSYIGNPITYPFSAVSALALTYSIVSGSIPNGLNLSSGGNLTGTLTTAGTFNFTLRITDSATNTVDRAFSIVVATAPTITFFTPTNFGTPTGAQQVTITGTNLVNGSVIGFVSVNNPGTVYNSVGTTYSSSTSMVGTIPSNIDTAQSPYYVRISSPETGQYQKIVTSSGSFNISSPPIVTSPTGTLQSASLPATVTTSGGAGTVSLSLTNNTANASLAGSSLTATQSGSARLVATDSAGQTSFQDLTFSFGLYAFSSFQFNTCGYGGIGGPPLSACQSTYGTSWAYNTSFYNVITINGYQWWKVPSTATYRIGAAGSISAYAPVKNCYGYGAYVQGDFALNAGDVLWLAVGQEGGIGNYGYSDQSSSSGGGATFVVFADAGNQTGYNSGGTYPLLVAAGGVAASEPRIGSGCGSASASQGISGGGFYGTGSNQFRGNLTSYYNGYGGMYIQGGFGGGVANDDVQGYGGGYDGTSPSPNSLIQGGSNQVRYDNNNGGRGYVNITKL